MNFSSNSKNNESKQMNVSKEADAAFMQELKRTDRPRYDRLIENMQKAAYRVK